MDPKISEINLNKPLPQNVLAGPNLNGKDEQKQHITSLLQQNLPINEGKTIEQQLDWFFTLEKHSLPSTAKKGSKKKWRNKRKMKKYGSSPCELIHEIEPSPCGWQYEQLVPIRDMWREYIKRCIGKPVTHLNDANSSSLRVILGKCEFIGADLKVEKCTDTSLIGVSGIVVRETQKMMGIVTTQSRFKKIYKKIAVFTFDVGHVQLTVIGKHLLTRPAERSVKKIKSVLFADI